MAGRLRRTVIAMTLVALLLSLGAAPVAAIVYGQQDVNNEYDNVGAIVADFEGDLFSVCTGTLIDVNVVLTAAHCLFGERMAVTFDNVLEEDVADNDLHWGDAIGHEDFACCGANDTFDVAVILLDDPIATITPADLPTANALGAMSAKQLKSALFETAGYGAVRDTRTTAFQALFSRSGPTLCHPDRELADDGMADPVDERGDRKRRHLLRRLRWPALPGGHRDVHHRHRRQVVQVDRQDVSRRYASRS